MWFFFFSPPLKNAGWIEAGSYFFNFSQFYWQFSWDFNFYSRTTCPFGERALILRWRYQSKIFTLFVFFCPGINSETSSNQRTDPWNENYLHWCLLGVLFYFFAHSTPAASLSGTHTGCCRFKVVVLLSPISFASVAWESSCEHPWFCTITEWELLEVLEKRLGGRELLHCVC